MAKANARLDAARKAYREALESARKSPTPEAWAQLLAAGKELSAAEDPRARRAPREAPGAYAAEPGEIGRTEPRAARGARVADRARLRLPHVAVEVLPVDEGQDLDRVLPLAAPVQEPHVRRHPHAVVAGQPLERERAQRSGGGGPARAGSPA